MTNDPRQALREGSMTSFQVVVVVICVVLNMVDGFDVLAMSFTAPLVAREWGVDPATLGVLLSAGLVGMGTGAIFISPIADVMGRRAVIILSTVIMSLGMFASAATSNVLELGLCRFATGLGIGGVLASGNTLLAEYAPTRWRDFTISMMVIGYPTGAIIGGTVFAYLVSEYGWRSAFLFGGAASTVMLPFIILYLPESLDFILTRRRENALAQVNRVLRRLGRPLLTALPAISREEAATKAVVGVIEPRYLKGTVLMTLSYFMLMFSFYFVLSWTPKNLVDLGFTVEQGILALLMINLGGIVGGLLCGYGTRRLERPLAHILDAGRFVLLHRGVRHDTNRCPADDGAGVPRGPRPDGRHGRPLHHRAACLSAQCAQHGHGPCHRHRPDRRDGRSAHRRRSDRGRMGTCRLLQRAGAPGADLGSRRALCRLFQRAGGACWTKPRGLGSRRACVRPTEQ